MTRSVKERSTYFGMNALFVRLNKGKDKSLVAKVEEHTWNLLLEDAVFVMEI